MAGHGGSRAGWAGSLVGVPGVCRKGIYTMVGGYHGGRESTIPTMIPSLLGFREDYTHHDSLSPRVPGGYVHHCIYPPRCQGGYVHHCIYTTMVPGRLCTPLYIHHLGYTREAYKERYPTRVHRRYPTRVQGGMYTPGYTSP